MRQLWHETLEISAIPWAWKVPQVTGTVTRGFA
jgi:hypothetical protein